MCELVLVCEHTYKIMVIFSVREFRSLLAPHFLMKFHKGNINSFFCAV